MGACSCVEFDPTLHLVEQSPRTRAWRPSVAWPRDLEQEGRHFSSGVNHPGEVRGLALSGRHVGITATEVRPRLLEELELYAGGLLELFVDSGAFSEVEFSSATGRLEIERPIADAAWQERFDLYAWAGTHFRRRARVVAPDCVGQQAETLTRLERWAPNVAAVAATRAQVIVPVQKGELPMSRMFATALEILGLRNDDEGRGPIAGVPMKKDATSLHDLAELVGSLPWYGARLHLLGLGPSAGKKFWSAIACIKGLRPNAEVTSDSVTIRRMVGRSNGRGGGPRVLTRYQDEGRSRGLSRPTEVKAYALQRQGHDQYEQDLDRAHAAGWFDDELFDSLAEAVAWRDARRVERARDASAVAG